MGDVLAFIEQREGRIRGAAGEAVSAAAKAASGLGGTVHALVVGASGVSAEASQLGSYGAAKVRVAESDDLGSYHPEAYSSVVADVVREGGYSAVIFTATGQGKDLAPRVAALLDVPLAADVTDLDASGDSLSVRRPVYSGKAFAQITLKVSPAIVSIRPNVFATAEIGGSAEVEIFSPSVNTDDWKTKVVNFEAAGSGQLDVAEASTVVSGGRGMKGPEHWNLLEDLRDALGSDAALGASRAVVDAGWRPHGEQVGQTGKTVAPKLYFAVGISGAIQHLAGMRTSHCIVAVNKDADAPIFNVADYGVVGDAFEVLPKLTEEIRALKGD